ncbi:tyrosine-type recombinase/integrase [Arcicella lustrica]|uniref:Site-specific integrase n=1 Tax=Arcicella lustrica TaxID=2984196 RepID=A0ABU5SDT0_9BACT|nr:site-specific integrase [Arcicella sp. DC25W]MEA5425450.1 site-specific integrase [Arcicella sp. DC25W]
MWSLSEPTKSAKQIRALSLYMGKDLPALTLLKVYQKYITDKKECWNGTPKQLAKNTIQRWYNCMKYLSEFLKDKDMELNEIDIDFGHRLYLYLIKKKQRRNTEKKIGHDYAVRNLTYLSEVLDFAKRKTYIIANPLDIEEYKRNPPKEIESLTQNELQTLAGFQFTGILEDARITFLAMAYSGLNHCDLHYLERIKDSESIVLKIDRQKNLKRYTDKAIIPILPELRKLLEAINYQLPSHDINVINRHLHVFEGLLCVDISITTYTARKTAGMLLSERGVSIDVVSKILGHTSIITTQRHYLKVVEKRVLAETKHLM